MALPKVVLFGDSLTQYSFYGDDGAGLGQAMQNTFKGRAEVLNEGLAGYTTETVKPQFTKLINNLRADPAGPPLLVTVWFGANDGTISPVNVPLPAFRANLHAFVASLLDLAHAPRVLLINAPPINVQRFGRAPPRSLAGEPPRPPPATDAAVAAAGTEAALAIGTEADAGVDAGRGGGEDAPGAAAVRDAAQGLGPRVYARKMAYSAAALDVAASFEDGRVAACDVWHAVVQHGLTATGRSLLPAGEFCVDRPWESMVRWRLPGSGLPLAEEFKEGMFEDGLHFGTEGYKVVTAAVYEAIREHWPDIL